jgi:hypothetical protein
MKRCSPLEDTVRSEAMCICLCARLVSIHENLKNCSAKRHHAIIGFIREICLPIRSIYKFMSHATSPYRPTRLPCKAYLLDAPIEIEMIMGKSHSRIGLERSSDRHRGERQLRINFHPSPVCMLEGVEHFNC